jgi:anaerobic selenocysteine-containing dehydrogenase
MAPHQGFHDPRAILMIGINPYVNGLGGLPLGHPNSWLKDSLAHGMALIVIDPRRTDVAKRATIFLQPRPGHDIAILAAMLRVVLGEHLHDRAFVTEHVRNIGALRRAVAPFDPAGVARAAGLDVDDLVHAARVFACAGRGFVVPGTGPHMAGQGTLLEYLALCLDTVCGHWLRKGETVRHAGVLTAPITPKAQAADPTPGHGFGERSRVRGLGMTAAGMPSATLAEEILLPGDGKVRALISCGGNPVAAFPDQLRTVEALQSLDLLVQIDPWMSQTAKLATYVIAPKMTLEMSGSTWKVESASRSYATGYGFPADYAHFTEAVVAPPAGAEVIEDWEFFYGVARRLRLQLHVATEAGPSVPIDMEHAPTADELNQMVFSGSRIPLDEVRRHPHGAFFPADPPVVVGPKDEGWTGRLDVGNAELMADLAAVPPVSDDAADLPFRLLNRRMMHIVNSSYNAGGEARRHNPAYMHPEDLTVLGLAPGDAVIIRSRRSSIPALVAADEALRRGTISMSFGFGGGPEVDDLFRTLGSNVERLLDAEDHPDRYSGQPRMSNIPVDVRAR